MEYREFLKKKGEKAVAVGIDVSEAAIHPMLFPFQRDITRWALRQGRAAIFADTGLGKALDADTLVLTPNGMCSMKDLKPNMKVIGANGLPTSVIGVFPQGVRPAFRVTFSDDSSVVCDAEHLWNVRSKTQRHRKQPWVTKTLQEIMSEGIGGPNQDRYRRWFIPMVEPVEFTEGELPLHPYLLGCLLGDGHMKNGAVSMSSADPELIEHLSECLPLGMVIVKRKYSQYDYAICREGMRSGHGPNLVHEALTELGIYGLTAESKFVPEVYKFASVETRLLVLQGMMDTDGSVWDSHGSSVLDYTTISKQLANDFAFLVQSLGGRVRIRTKKTSHQLAYRMTPAFPMGMNPFLLNRKAKAFKPRTKYPPARSIRNIEQVEDREMVCIKVDAPDELFVVDGFIVTHNTLIQVEWSQLLFHRLKIRTLIIAPLSVARQTVQEAAKLGIPVHYTREGTDLADTINITNYELVEKFNAEDFGAVVLDESSILKNVAGAYRQALTAQWANTPYRLCCTATPAPNDITEIANHAEFLGVSTRTNMLAAYFVHDDEGWRLKGHAQQAFYRWLASWSMAIRKPSDLGYSDEGYVLPPLTVTPHWVDVSIKPVDKLFFMGLHGIQDRATVRKSTMGDRVAQSVALIQQTEGQWIAWVGMNDEGRLLHQALPESVLMEGSQSPEQKQEALERFQRGDVRVLITKVKIAGFGMNLQNAHQMVFVGLNDSWEGWYQAIRRCYRFGQTEPVAVHVVLSEAERPIFSNVQAKEEEAMRMQEALIQQMTEYERKALEGQTDVRSVYAQDDASGNGWRLMLGDSVERLSEVESDSIGLSVYSPPFLSLYTYSPSERDMGNSQSADEFFRHYQFLLAELLRVTMPGRLTAVHCAQVAAMKERDGWIGLKDFRGDLIRAYTDAGWIYHGEVCIDKDPQAQAIRTHAKGLMFVQLRKDSSWMRPALADYILLFRKPGENAIPVSPDITNDEWIEWARPIWYGIRESDTLNVVEARESDDERHIAPLQLGTIERCIRLWSNLGEIVLSPFAGIGSEGYMAVKLGRQFIGCELKPAYWKVAAQNIRQAVWHKSQPSLFDAEG